METGLVDLN